MEQEENRRFYNSLLFPGILIVVIWTVKLLESVFNTSLAEFGLLPQTLVGLRGILFSPLLHGDWAHLWANTVPLFILTAGLFYYYNKKATTIFILCWMVTGLWVWIFAKDTGIHIGASGIIYSLATFHFTGGILRREPRMMAFSLLVVFLYGGLIWGIIPDFFPEKNISWQSHLLGGLAGILIAFAYRDEGPQRKVYLWEEENEDEDIEHEDEDDNDETESSGNAIEENPNTYPKNIEDSTTMVKVKYIYKELK